ncbi:MAG: homocysteine S-methyltransferase family protein, partial [Sarcina sp.]
MKVKVFDGAMGSMIQKIGLNLGEHPEFLNIENPECIRQIHKQYVESGCDFLTTNTFGANNIKFKNTKYEVYEIVKEGIKLAKEARAQRDVLIALDIGPTGQLLQPMGTLSFDEAYNTFKEVVLIGVENKVDVILIETMTDLYEAKAAILAAKENSDLPVFCTMSFEQNERTFTGCTPESMVMTLEALGIDVIGVNCSLGPKELKGVIERILKVATIPIMIQPNAGLPKIINGKTMYTIDVKEFGACINDLVNKGISIIGGCCGTTPEYIKELKNLVKERKITKLNNKKICGVCTSSKVVNIDGVTVIGERINPTGKNIFKEALKKGDMDYILGKAIEQVEAGAHILDIHVGIPDIDEEETMVKLV